MKKFLGFSHYINVLVFGIIALFGRTYEHSLSGDNILYAGISRNILTSENPLIMTSGGEVYLNKPPLFFWLNSLFIYIFGNNTFGAKFVSIIFTILLLILIFKLASETFQSTNIGYLSVLFFLVNYIVFKNAQACRLESLVTLLLMCGLATTYYYIKTEKMSYMLLTGLSCGLVVLTKGLMGIVFFSIIIVALIMFSKELRKLKLLKDIILSALVCVITFGWWYAYAFANTDLYNIMIVEQSLKRTAMATGGKFKSEPIYSYLLLLAKYSFIMIPFFILGFRKILQTKLSHTGVRLFLFFTVVYFIMLHFVSTKYDRYLFTIMPMLAMASGVGLSMLIKRDMKPIFTGLYLCFAFMLCVLPVDTGQEGYEVLIKSKEVARKNNLKICVQDKFKDHWAHQGGLDFYLDKSDYEVGICRENSINVTDKNADCLGDTLYRNKRLRVCIN